MGKRVQCSFTMVISMFSNAGKLSAVRRRTPHLATNPVLKHVNNYAGNMATLHSLSMKMMEVLCLERDLLLIAVLVSGTILIGRLTYSERNGENHDWHGD